MRRLTSRGSLRDVEAEDLAVPARRPQHPRHHLDGRRLPAPFGPRKREELAGLDDEIERVDRDALLEVLVRPTSLDYGCRNHRGRYHPRDERADALLAAPDLGDVRRRARRPARRNAPRRAPRTVPVRRALRGRAHRRLRQSGRRSSPPPAGARGRSRRADRRPGLRRSAHASRVRGVPRGRVRVAQPRPELPGESRGAEAGSASRCASCAPPRTPSSSPTSARRPTPSSRSGRRRSRRRAATAFRPKTSCARSARSGRSRPRIPSASSPRSSARTRCPTSSSMTARRICACFSTRCCPPWPKRGSPTACDVFCEEGVFDASQSRQILRRRAEARIAREAARGRDHLVRRGRARGRGRRALGRPPRSRIDRTGCRTCCAPA